MEKVFVVLGYSNSGSGSLTFPEDFDFLGFYTDPKEAQDHVDRLNQESGFQDENGDEVDDFDGMVYEVEQLENLSSKK